MHKTRTKRQQLAIRSFTYGVMTLAAAISVTICLLFAMGYRFDFADGKLTQVALVQFKSYPSSATVDVNGKKLSSTTPNRYNVQSGENVINVSKTSYRNWSKTVKLEASEVLWLDYLRLIPNSITTNTVRSYGSISQIQESPDRNWILIRNSDNERRVSNCPEGSVCDSSYAGYYNNPYVLQLAEVTDPNNIKFTEIQIDPTKLTVPTSDQSEKFSIVEWDDGSRYAILRHQVADSSEYLVIDRQNPTVTKNLNKDFGMSVEDPHFSGTSGETFFVKTGTDLRKLEYSGKTVSAPIVSGLVSYQMYDNDKLSFVATKTTDGKVSTEVGVYKGNSAILKTFDDDNKTLAGVSIYNGTEYLAIARSNKVEIFSLPLSQRDAETYNFSADQIDWLDFSPNDRFIAVGSGEKVSTYDLDTHDRYSFEIKGLASTPQWLDGFHMVGNEDGINLLEFDGANREGIVSGSGRAMLSSDEKYLFSVGQVSGGMVLQRSKLVVD